MMRGPPPTDSRTDEALLEAFRGGEQLALATLYDRHARTVLAFAWRYCGDGDLAEDVVQDCFRELIDRIHEFELRGKLTSWFYVVAKRRALRLRDRAWRAQGELDEASLAIPDEGPPETEDLRRLLSRLPATRQEVLVLRFLDGWDLQSIAAALEIPLGTVKSRIHNALEQLRSDQVCRKYFDREDS
jgi:RNA polymerase sigma-70 factor (ECF subfamily)